MAFHKQHNTRFSARFNAPGQFVPAAQQPTFSPAGSKSQTAGLTTQTLRAPGPKAQTFAPAGPQNEPPQNMQESIQQEADMKVEPDNTSMSTQDDDELSKPLWMRGKLSGLKKISNRERRRRQNQSLRRLLTPKNALMVLNEMMPNEHVANQFKVEQALSSQFGYKASNNVAGFCADLTIDGNIYKGYGDNKLTARNAAAEQAIRDLMLKKMNRPGSDTGSISDGDAVQEEETLPMIQLASFALHKLFTEWEYEGHKVPQLKTSPAEEVKMGKELPANAESMHPCMLLTYMRPHLQYREVAVEGDRPQNMAFTMALDVDGHTYLGKGPNKREARRAAARAACLALFQVHFQPHAAPAGPAPAPAPAGPAH